MGATSKTESVRCVRDIREFPPESYRLPKDGRKWLALCKERRALANQIATYANGDGTSITAGVDRWVRELGIKRRTLFRRLDDLRQLGVLRDKHGLVAENGTAIRSLDLSALKMPEEAKPEVPDSAAGVSDSVAEVSDSTYQECQIDRSGVPDSTAGVPDRRGGVPNTRVFGTQPSFLPSTNRPPNRQEIFGRLAGIHQEAGKGKLSKIGLNDVLSLPEKYGIDDARIEQLYQRWLGNRDIGGLNHPLTKFVAEFPEALASLQTLEKRRANHTANLQKIAQSEAAVAAWTKALEELSEQPSFNRQDRGSDKWVSEVRAWAVANPCPPRLVELSNGELGVILAADSAVEGCILLGRHYADSIFVACL